MKRIILIIAALAIMGCSDDGPMIVANTGGACHECYLCVKGFERVPYTKTTDLLIVETCGESEVQYRVSQKCHTPPDTIIVATLVDSHYEAVVPKKKAVTVWLVIDGQVRSWTCIESME